MTWRQRSACRLAVCMAALRILAIRILAVRILAVCMVAGALIWPALTRGAQWRYLIAGRVEDPHGLRPANVMVTVGFDRDGVGYGVPMAVAADGSFVTHALSPGTYVLTVIRNPYSTTERSMPVGLTIARLENADVTDVIVTIQPDTALEGRFSMEPGTPRPSSIAVSSCLAAKGVRLAGCLAADGRADGTFVIRNAYGPRVLHVAVNGGDGRHYAEPRVLLDGADITRQPTDFSTKTAATLEIVLSRAAVSAP